MLRIAADLGHPVAGLRTPQLVGRTDELAALRASFEVASAVVLMEGEAGVGKSRLVQELSGPTVLTATCPPLREPFTLGCVVDALRRVTTDIRHMRKSPLTGTLRPFFPEWAEYLPPAPEPGDDPTTARHRLFRALAELIEDLEVGLLEG